MKLKVILLALSGFLVAHGFMATQGLRGDIEYNPFCLKRSPYGEIIGAAMQDPVHLMSHGGVGHEHVKHDSAGGCESCVGCQSCSTEPSDREPTKNDLWLQPIKKALLALEVEVRQNNFPGRRSDAVRLYEAEMVKEMMTEAYEMDPTDYGNYNLVSSYAYGKEGLSGLERVSKDSLRYTEKRNWDPSDALTAASAAENMLIFRVREYGFEDRERFAADYQLFVDKVANYQRVFNRAVEDERIYSFKQEKIDEMVKRFGYFNYTLREYGKRLGVEPAPQQ